MVWNTRNYYQYYKLIQSFFVLEIMSYKKKLFKLVYLNLFESHIIYSFICGVHQINRIFNLQKRAIRPIDSLKARNHCTEVFKRLEILTVSSVFIYEVILYAKYSNQLAFNTTHSYKRG